MCPCAFMLSPFSNHSPKPLTLTRRFTRVSSRLCSLHGHMCTARFHYMPLSPFPPVTRLQLLTVLMLHWLLSWVLRKCCARCSLSLALYTLSHPISHLLLVFFSLSLYLSRCLSSSLPPSLFRALLISFFIIPMTTVCNFNDRVLEPVLLGLVRISGQP